MGIPFFQMIFIGLLPSALKVMWYRMRGARIGKRVRIAPLAVLLSNDIEIGDDCRIGMMTFIRARKIRLGNRVRIGTLVAMDTGEIQIGHDSQVMEQCVVGGMLTPRSSLYIGCRVKVFPYCFLNPTEPIVIEDDVGVGGSTYIFTHGSWQSALDGFPIGFGPVTLRKGVWLPWRVFIMPKVEIGQYATIGAGSVINKSVPAYALAAGMPAKVISEDGKHLRPMDFEQKWKKVLEIIDELAEFLEYQGAQLTMFDDEYGRVMQVVHGNHFPSAKVHIVRSYECQVPSCDVLISLSKIDSDLQRVLVSSNIACFDIENGQASLTNNPMVEQVRNYFSRYGVRFSVEADEAF